MFDYSSPFIFAPQELKHILGEVVSAAGKRQLRIAETEKYPHVTYFFNGGIERAFPGEDRKTHSFAESRDVRFETGDERVGSHR